MKTQCKNIDLLGFSEGILSDKEAVVVRSHIEQCPDCRGFLKELGSFAAIIDAERAIVENPFFFTRVEEGILRPAGGEKTFIRRLIPTFAAVLFFAGGVFAGINIGKLYGVVDSETRAEIYETKLYIDDLAQEPIESYLINLNDDDKE